jgi:spore germination cell wall hydrolase CwlJ-like protein
MKNNDPAILSAISALNKAASGAPDPTKGATHYYAVTLQAPPEWANGANFTVQIGKHRFYNGVH